MGKKLAAIVLCVCLTVVSAHADPAVDAANNAHYEFTTCHAYFSVVSGCAALSKYPKTAKLYERAADHVLAYMLVLGEKANLSEDAMLSRTKLSIMEMGKLAAGGCQNISSLTVRFADRCKRAAEEPAKIYEEYLIKEHQKN